MRAVTLAASYPVFPRRKLYIKALLTHKEYDRKEWKKQRP